MSPIRALGVSRTVEFWNQTVTYTVVAMNETNFTINVSANGPGYFYSPENWSEPWSKSWSENWPKEWAFGADVDIGDFETNYDLTRVYKENITTNWGPLSCDHYYPAYIYGGQPEFGYDAWVKDGILVKWVKTYLQTNPTERTTRMLIDTNIPAITNP